MMGGRVSSGGDVGKLNVIHCASNCSPQGV